MKPPLLPALLLSAAAMAAAHAAPVVTNLPVTNLQPRSATATVRVTDYTGTVPEVVLHYGTSDGGTVEANWSSSLPLGQVTASANGVLPGLTPGTPYFCRASVSNSTGTAWAPAAVTFTTLTISAPTVVNLEADKISLTKATLKADVTGTGNEAPSLTFYYGTTDGGTSAAAWTGSVTLPSAAGKTGAPVSGLTAATGYFFRAAVSNSAGTAWAPASGSFTTDSISLPTVRTDSATHVRSSMATLNGKVTKSGHDDPSVVVYWGTADGGTVPASWQHSVALGTQDDSFSTIVSGLTPGATYLFRAFAGNSAGGVWSAESAAFITALTESAPLVVINEVHYDPINPTLPQEFIELHNPGAVDIDLTGWRISSAVDYTFGAITLPAGGYFCVVQDPARFASTWPAAASRSAGPWAGKLKNSGETIKLLNASGGLVTAVDYQAGFPWPTDPNGAGPSMELLHPALDPGVGASWRRSVSNNPSPGAANSVVLASASDAPPAIRQVKHSPERPDSTSPVLITATVTDADGVGSVALRYQLVPPGGYIRKTESANAPWTFLVMADNGTGGDSVAGDSVYTATMPAAARAHRLLVRYQITVTDTLNNSVKVPYTDDEQLNFAYFVYDSIPGWGGAMRPAAFGGFPATPVETYSPALLESIEPWHLIVNQTDMMNSQYNGSQNPFWGTLVYRGKVYDNIHYNVRGIGSTYVSGKNKWGLKFNRARDFQAYDNWGRPFAETWNSLGLNACASPWASVNRGAAGIDEAAPFRIFELGGVPSLRTSYVHWRVIRRAAEVNDPTAVINDDPLGTNLKGQYSGDLWGLYLALEPTEGNFLDERGLGDGNIYSIEGNSGDKKHQGPDQPVTTSDWDQFRNSTAQANQTEAWYRANNDLDVLYSFLALSRLVGNVDVRPADNYRYYHRPEDNRWVIMPYDLDMMFIAAHHWGGAMDSGRIVAGFPNSSRAISRHPAIALEYRNRCRELLSLMASDADPAGGQIGQLLHEYAGLINPQGSPLTWSDLDAAMWNQHPRTAGSGATTGQSSHKNNFFRGRYRDGTRGGLGGTLQTSSWIRDIPGSLPNGFGDHEGLTQFFINFSTNTYPADAATWVRKASNSGGSGTDNDLNRQKGYGYKYLEWESLFGGWTDSVNVVNPATADTSFPYTPVISAAGAPGFPAGDLQFTSTGFEDPDGTSSAAAVEWRLGEISAPGIPGYEASRPSVYELSTVWSSGEIALTSAAVPGIRIPAQAVVPGHTYRARVRHQDDTGRWSFWSAPVQFIPSGVDTANYQNALRITEINFNPAAVTPAESASPLWDPAWNAQQFEFIELTNISASPVDLTDVRFTKGIDYDFPAGTSLAAGARIIVAKNPVAFEIRYGPGLPLAPGHYDPDSLSNGGEQLKLSYGAGIAIFDFEYRTDSPWPEAADGGGPSLVLINPADPGLDHGSAYAWRASGSNGNPGADDRISYNNWATGYPGIGAAGDDFDRDGLTNSMEFALNSDPASGASAPGPEPAVAGNSFQIRFNWNPAHTGFTWHGEFSTDAAAWPGQGTLINRVTEANGTFTDTWQSPWPVTPSASRQLGRLRITAP